ncbi:MAG: hypothetical protein Q8P16_02680, partial [bacterium]|nr:hypothetical protein [bacterium]
GMSREEEFREVVAKGFTEPGARDFDEAVANELKDVAYKAAILANHSGMLGQIVTPGDVPVVQYAEGRYAAVIIRDGGIHAGFLPLSATSWLPSGVNNVLYINGEKIAEGPGAGCRVTAERMWKDSRALI